MQPDLLQQLRDIHTPVPPHWWPPAPGWWIVAVMALAVAWLLASAAWRAWQRRQPIRRARQLHAVLAQRRRDGLLDDRAYVNACNDLLKRLLVHGLGVDAARPVADDRWLAMLDAALGEPAFTRGAGQSLGNMRFAPAVTIDVEALEALMNRLLARIAPDFGERMR
jgi:hypothetical protein